MELIVPNTWLPMRLRLSVPMNDEEFIRFGAANDDLQIEREPNGEILVMSPTGGKTSKMNSRLTRLLDEWAEADGRGCSFESNGGFQLDDSSIKAPDAAWVERSRWDALTDDQQSGHPPLCPDFVMELRSPSDRLSKVQERMVGWLAKGAKLAWIVDPFRRVVEIYRPGQEAEVVEGAHSVAGEGPIAGFVLNLERLWE